jgi:hypothetical protein
MVLKQMGRWMRPAAVAMLLIAVATLSVQPARAGDRYTQPPQATSGGAYGVNQDGWEVQVVNQSNVDLAADPPGATDNVASMSPTLQAGTTASVKGRESIFGGPANMNFAYLRGGFQSAGFEVVIRDSRLGLSVYCDHTNVSCTVTRRNETSRLWWLSAISSQRRWRLGQESRKEEYYGDPNSLQKRF